MIKPSNRLPATGIFLTAILLLVSCDKTAENTNKPVIIQGYNYAIDNENVVPTGTLQIAPGQILNITVKFTDPDGGNNPDPAWYKFSWAVERINFGASSFNPNDYFIVHNENPAIWTAPQVTGFYRFIVEVRDRYDSPSIDNVVVEVSSNKKPVINSFSISNTNPFVNEEITLSVEATDPDGNLPLEFQWSATGGFFTSENNGTAKWMSAASGSFQITVSITDQAGGTISRTIPINVQANHPPVIEGWVLDPPDSVKINQIVKITITASDIDNDELEFNWSADKGTFNLVNKNQASWRAPASAEIATITCVVLDRKGGSDTANISINVIP